MPFEKCQKCGTKVLFYRDESTGAEKCPSCGTTNPHTPTNSEAYIESPTNISKAREVVIEDIRMPFWSMVVFMVKWAFASIPAMIIIAIVLSLCFSVLVGLGLISGLGASQQ
jgi:DNA-directed RNA polymerase subunit M/transcription elongation factor TFIIS|tara:strand:- start:611 stop:946 length:336 start_codon:yes stop_codon:yes gene_type:complete